MIRYLKVLGLLFWVLAKAAAQDTFSLLIADPQSRQIISAGASCIDSTLLPRGAAAISTMLPGLGALHTQSYYSPDNQSLGTRLLEDGLSAKQTVDSLEAGDVSYTPMFRQYLALSMADQMGQNVETAAFTGSACEPWAGQIIGEGYVLAGNILIDSTVLKKMEKALLQSRNSGGNIEAQALAAMKAAAFPGADRRCLKDGISSRSAFFRVAGPERLDYEIIIPYPFGMADPILLLEEAWKARFQTR